MPTTCFRYKRPGTDKIITGEEIYPIVGDLLTPGKIERIMLRMKGLSRYWNCIEKARIAREVLGFGEIVLGECLVWSNDFKSSYGFYFNPPFEFHAWVQIYNSPLDWYGKGMRIVDVALPGVIELGLATHDHIGPCVVGREPFILAGEPPDWVEYKSVTVL